jgi:predicted dehydrogenase
VKTNLVASVIGLGVGESHIAGYESHPSCSVTKLCDFNKEVLEEVGSSYQGKILTSNQDDIICDPEVDIVSIASYDDFHKDQVIRSLQNGKHVFVEKPLCVSSKELSSIVEVMRKNPKLKVSSNLILRKCPRFVELRKRIQSSELGQIFHMESSYDYGRLHKLTEGWRGEMPNYSVTLGGGIHLIDLMSWISGERFDQVFAYGNELSTQESTFSGNSLTSAIMKSNSGCTTLLTSNFGSVTPHHHKLAIYGTKGTFEQSHSAASYFSSRDPSVPSEKVDSPYPGAQKGDLVYDFVDSILGERLPLVKAQEVIDAMSVGLAIDESIQTQTPQPVNYEDLDD